MGFTAGRDAGAAMETAMDSIPAILKIDAGGLPVAWIHWQTAVVLYARERVRWEAGAERFLIRGGINARTGCRSEIRIGSIIAVADRSRRHARGVPMLTNRTLFQRDRHLCLYCGRQYAPSQLTRDHVFPASRGGLSAWENCVTACRSCNQRKDDRTPEEANMKLLAIPYTPNLAEYLILSNRRILADQMEFLLAHAPSQNRAS
jgi:5-methylcytosine-specific restriction endonuclease McrA